MVVDLILLDKATAARIIELNEEIVLVDKPDVNGNKCVHVSTSGKKCTNRSSKQSQNGWLCIHHQEFIDFQIQALKSNLRAAKTH